LKQDGIILEEALTNWDTVSRVPIISALSPEDTYDLIVVTVRLDQLDTVIPVLRQNMTKTIMLMLNNPGGVDALREKLPGKELLLGFPGVGGILEGSRISYIQIKQQRTTIGRPSGEPGRLVMQVREMLKLAEFEVTVCWNMDAWLKTHAVFVSCMAAAILLEGGSSTRLGRDKKAVGRLVKSVRQGFEVCRALGLPVGPFNLKTIFLLMPGWIGVKYWQKALQGVVGRLSIEPHCKVAKGEMLLLAKQVLTLSRASGHSAPVMRGLLNEFIEQYSTAI
jgi:2-dehydropantoate 2-reductase